MSEADSTKAIRSRLGLKKEGCQITKTIYIFIIRFIGGVSISIFLMSLGYIAKCNTATNCLKLFQNIGQNTLSIYMLQSLLVEAALNRFVQLPNNHIGYITSIFIAIFMTFISWYIIKCTTKIKLLGVLLFGK